ncbi:MAG: drug:proton antiporter, partial [Paracoccaceae bacterium]|nr:drug:proton antiporter [Paracoccaceae bacterium]
MSSFALKLAVRELRGGLNGFRIFLLCLMLGVGAIAAVGLVRAAIESGLKSQGAALLGGDAALKFTYRFASDAEKDWMAGQAVRVSEIADFRSMVVVNEETGLTQIKAVDSAYPLVGAVTLTPEIPLTQALALQSKLPGAVMDGVLVARMGLSVGQSFMLGTKSFELTAILTQEPDNATSGFSLGPRTLVMNQMLKGSGLLQEGTMFDSLYRLELPQGTDLDVFKERVSQRWPDGSVRYYDSRRASPGVERFVERMGSFLILVGLAGLAVGGVGISSAVRAYLDGKIATIATLKTLGASGRLIFQVYLTQIALLAGLGV